MYNQTIQKYFFAENSPFWVLFWPYYGKRLF